MAPFVFFFLFLASFLVHNSIADVESTSSFLQVQDDQKMNHDASSDAESPFLHGNDDPRGMRNEVQKKRSSFVALRGKKFPFGLPLFGLKRASAYIPVRGRRLNLDYFSPDDLMSMADDQKRASSFYVGRGKKDSPFLYPAILDTGRINMVAPGGQAEFDGYPESHGSSMETSWMENGGHESENELVRKRAQAFFGARGKRSMAGF